jgi:hypothetical protein
MPDRSQLEQEIRYHAARREWRRVRELAEQLAQLSEMEMEDNGC